MYYNYNNISYEKQGSFRKCDLEWGIKGENL